MEKEYVLGNWLRGYVNGHFSDKDTAWSWLSNRFLLSFPTESGGRIVSMWVREMNQYGIEELIQCVSSKYTEINDLPKEEVLEKCKTARYALL